MTFFFQDETKPAEIRDFIAANDKPLVGEYASPAKRYEGRPLVLVFYTVDFSFDYRDGMYSEKEYSRILTLKVLMTTIDALGHL